MDQTDSTYQEYVLKLIMSMITIIWYLKDIWKIPTYVKFSIKTFLHNPEVKYGILWKLKIPLTYGK